MKTTAEELAGALQLPEAYPHRPESVGFQQTQMSLLFFAGDYVYKVKKPVNLGYLDYSTLSDRHRLCLREVELNRRLCVDVYLGVVPIVRQSGHLLVEHEGEPVEYAVKMRRLPQDRMLDTLLSRKLATAGMMEATALKVAAFHEKSETSDEVAAFGGITTIRQNTDENFEQTAPNIGTTITVANHEMIRAFTNGFIETNAPLFSERVRGGRIRDCHGDLHAAHICMTDDICIYDCIEFNDRFRYGDVASEVAFLAMDLDRLGRQDLSRTFVSAYQRASADEGIEALIPFYKCYRAFVRGKVEGFKLADPLMPEEERRAARRLARRYFHLAAGYASGKGLLVVMSGLTGSGKSTVAGELRELLGCELISSDVVRKQLAGLSPTDRRYEPFGEGIYSEAWTERTYEEMLRQARSVLSTGGCAILDAAFLREEERERARQVAEQASARVLLVECVAPYEVMVERLVKRQAGNSLSDGRPEILDGQIRSRETVAGLSNQEHVTIDTACDPADLVEEIWRKI